MSMIFYEGGVEAEPNPSWYSVICGQGTYDVRAFSHDHAGVQVQQYLKEVGDPVGFPLTFEHDADYVANLERIWRLTGGDPACSELARPILRSYIEINPYVWPNEAAQPPKQPQLFTFEYLKSSHSNVLDQTRQDPDRLRVTKTWVAESVVSGLIAIMNGAK